MTQFERNRAQPIDKIWSGWELVFRAYVDFSPTTTDRNLILQADGNKEPGGCRRYFNKKAARRSVSDDGRGMVGNRMGDVLFVAPLGLSLRIAFRTVAYAAGHTT